MMHLPSLKDRRFDTSLAWRIEDTLCTSLAFRIEEITHLPILENRRYDEISIACSTG
jgi:hypothetical protein